MQLALLLCTAVYWGQNLRIIFENNPELQVIGPDNLRPVGFNQWTSFKQGSEGEKMATYNAITIEVNDARLSELLLQIQAFNTGLVLNSEKIEFLLVISQMLFGNSLLLLELSAQNKLPMPLLNLDLNQQGFGSTPGMIGGVSESLLQLFGINAGQLQSFQQSTGGSILSVPSPLPRRPSVFEWLETMKLSPPAPMPSPPPYFKEVDFDLISMPPIPLPPNPPTYIREIDVDVLSLPTIPPSPRPFVSELDINLLPLLPTPLPSISPSYFKEIDVNVVSPPPSPLPPSPFSSFKELHINVFPYPIRPLPPSPPPYIIESDIDVICQTPIPPPPSPPPYIRELDISITPLPPRPLPPSPPPYIRELDINVTPLPPIPFPPSPLPYFKELDIDVVSLPPTPLPPSPPPCIGEIDINVTPLPVPPSPPLYVREIDFNVTPLPLPPSPPPHIREIDFNVTPLPVPPSPPSYIREINFNVTPLPPIFIPPSPPPYVKEVDINIVSPPPFPRPIPQPWSQQQIVFPVSPPRPQPQREVPTQQFIDVVIETTAKPLLPVPPVLPSIINVLPQQQTKEIIFSTTTPKPNYVPLPTPSPVIVIPSTPRPIPLMPQPVAEWQWIRPVIPSQIVSEIEKEVIISTPRPPMPMPPIPTPLPLPIPLPQPWFIPRPEPLPLLTPQPFFVPQPLFEPQPLLFPIPQTPINTNWAQGEIFVQQQQQVVMPQPSSDITITSTQMPSEVTIIPQPIYQRPETVYLETDWNVIKPPSPVIIPFSQSSTSVAGELFVTSTPAPIWTTLQTQNRPQPDDLVDNSALFVSTEQPFVTGSASTGVEILEKDIHIHGQSEDCVLVQQKDSPQYIIIRDNKFKLNPVLVSEDLFYYIIENTDDLNPLKYYTPVTYPVSMSAGVTELKTLVYYILPLQIKDLLHPGTLKIQNFLYIPLNPQINRFTIEKGDVLAPLNNKVDVEQVLQNLVKVVNHKQWTSPSNWQQVIEGMTPGPYTPEAYGSAFIKTETYKSGGYPPVNTGAAGYEVLPSPGAGVAPGFEYTAGVGVATGNNVAASGKYWISPDITTQTQGSGTVYPTVTGQTATVEVASLNQPKNDKLKLIELLLRRQQMNDQNTLKFGAAGSNADENGYWRYNAGPQHGERSGQVHENIAVQSDMSGLSGIVSDDNLNEVPVTVMDATQTASEMHVESGNPIQTRRSGEESTNDATEPSEQNTPDDLLG